MRPLPVLLLLQRHNIDLLHGVHRRQPVRRHLLLAQDVPLVQRGKVLGDGGRRLAPRLRATGAARLGRMGSGGRQSDRDRLCLRTNLETILHFQMGYEPKTFSCTIVEKDNKSPEVFLIVVGIVIPFVIMAGSYSLIFYKVSVAHKFVSEC